MLTQLELFPDWVDNAPRAATPSYIYDGPQNVAPPNNPQRTTSELNKWFWSVGRMFSFGFSTKVMFKGGVFSGLTLQRKDTGWLAVLKCSYKGKPYVAFENSDTLYKLTTTLYLKMSGGGFKWKPDQFKRKG